MIELFTYGSTNGHKVAIALEELGLPYETRTVIELIFLQASLQGPMFGQRMHFSLLAPEVLPYAIRRYEEQGDIIDRLTDRLLTGRDYFLGADYSIVDIAFYAWYLAAEHVGFGFHQHRHLAAWFERVGARPAVKRGAAVPAKLPPLPKRRRV